MAFDYEAKLNELQNDSAFAEKLTNAKTANDIISVYKEFDIELTDEEAEEIIATMQVDADSVTEEEFTEEQLDEVSGGLAIAGVVIPAILWKTALALVATCGVVAGIKKLKKKFAEYF